jgi:hypothetical protein
MNNENFQLFIDILNQSTPSIKDGELVVPLSPEIEKFDKIEGILNNIGYTFDDVRTIRQGKVSISLNAVDWKETCPIFNLWDDIFSIVNNSSKLPQYFYVLETNESSFDDTQNKKALELFCSTRQLLATLADQCEPPEDGCAKGSRSLFFIIETDNGIAKYNFRPIIDWNELNSIPIENGQFALVEQLHKLITLGDSQDSERRSVMRSAFHEIISTCNSNAEILKKTLCSIESFHKRYEEHYDIFVRRFSINKVLHEINEKDLTYTSKINEILSNAQNKALTIPGALIVIAAVMKIDQVIDGVAVAIGMLITTIIVHRSLDVFQSTFKHIEKQVTAEFKRYDILNEKVEIRKKAQQTILDLSDLINKAKNNTTFMKKSIWSICAVAVFFILAVLFRDNTSTIQPEIIKQPISMPSQENTDLKE